MQTNRTSGTQADGEHPEPRDAMGVLREARRFIYAHPAPWIVLALSLLATAAGWFMASNNARINARRMFDEEAYAVATALAERMLVYEDILHGAVGLFASSISVERDEWRAYIESVSIDRRFPGIDALCFMEYVRKGELSEFLSATRADGAPDFDVRTSEEAEDYLIVKFIEPASRHAALMGEDAGLDPKRRAIAEAARDTGEAAITESLPLSGTTDRGFLMVLPVYQNQHLRNTIAERREGIHGWVYARFVTAQLVSSILGDRSQKLVFHLYDDTLDASGPLMFESEPRLANHTPMFMDEVPFPTAGRRWRLVFMSKPGFESGISYLWPRTTALGGIVLSFLLFGIVLSMSTTRERALAMASEMTSALRAANERLEYEKYLLQALMDNVPDRIYFKDREHRFIRNNRAHLSRFGIRDPDEAVGRTDADFFSAEHAQQARRDEEEILRTGRPMTKEERETWPDGSVTWALTTKMPLRDEQDRVVGTFGISRDITDRKRAEEAMLRAKEAAEDANRTKSQFLASMSHELRTPLNSIIGFANILLKNKGGTLSPADLNFLDRIQANGRHLLGLINEILDLSKIEARKLDVRLSPVALDDLVRETITQGEGLVRDKPVQLVAELPEVLKPMLADADKLKQVLINLIGNAVKFTERGQITVRVRAHPDDYQPTRLEVADTGIGIPREKLGVIFKAFEQAETGTARKYGGTGLGLTISQALCHLMGYRIHADSEPGRGSTFTVVFRDENAPPAASPAADAPVDAARAPESQSVPAPEPLTGKMVLVIDDEADSRTLVTHAVEETGCQAISAESGELGLIMARRLRPHLITTDLLMPGMDGWQVLRELKSDPALRSIPVIVVSVVAGENRGRIFGPVEVLQKPIHREALIAALMRSFLPPMPKVLAIDDQEDALRLLTGMLAGQAGEIRTARNGREGLERLRDFSPDIVLLDLVMPEMDGVQFLNALRADPQHQHLPVLVLTAKDLTASESESLRQEAIAITKKAGAFEEDLKRLIHKLLAKPSQSNLPHGTARPPEA